MNDGTSSQNSSQWRYMETVNGLNHLDLSWSDFDMKSRIMAFVSYKAEYANNFATTIGLYYNGLTGDPYSYVYNDYPGLVNGEGENTGNLIWVPASQDEINLIDITDDDGNVTMSAAEQWNALNSFIENDDYLSENRGGYAERNAARTPFESIIDLKIAQDFYLNAGGKKHLLQVTFDVFNFTNMLNKDWGARRYVSYGAYGLINYEGMGEGNTPMFTYDGPTDPEDILNVNDSGINSSRWQAQLGVRYTFN
jgi:hypothetical protein